MTTTTSEGPKFHVRSRLGAVRDLAIVGVCVAIVAGFVAQVWNAPSPSELRGLADPATAEFQA